MDTRFIEVFKTSVQTATTATLIVKQLNHLFPHYQVNFDLEDEEKILRMDGRTEKVAVEKVIRMLQERGFTAELLL